MKVTCKIVQTINGTLVANCIHALKVIQTRLAKAEAELALLRKPTPDIGSMLAEQQKYGEVLGLYFALGVLEQLCKQEEGTYEVPEHQRCNLEDM